LTDYGCKDAGPDDKRKNQEQTQLTFSHHCRSAKFHSDVIMVAMTRKDVAVGCKQKDGKTSKRYDDKQEENKMVINPE